MTPHGIAHPHIAASRSIRAELQNIDPHITNNSSLWVLQRLLITAPQSPMARVPKHVLGANQEAMRDALCNAFCFYCDLQQRAVNILQLMTCAAPSMYGG